MTFLSGAVLDVKVSAKGIVEPPKLLTHLPVERYDAMIERWDRENIGCSLVKRISIRVLLDATAIPAARNELAEQAAEERRKRHVDFEVHKTPPPYDVTIET